MLLAVAQDILRSDSMLVVSDSGSSLPRAESSSDNSSARASRAEPTISRFTARAKLRCSNLYIVFK